MPVANLILQLLLFSVALQVSQERPTPVSQVTKEFEQYTVTAVAAEEYDDDGNRKIRLTIRHPTGAATKNIEFANRTDRLFDLYSLPSDKVLVHGELRSRGDILTIVDISRGRVIDTAWGWGATLSKDRKLIAYEFRYPPHGLQQSRTAVVLLYDLTRTPLENSVTGRTDNPLERGFILYPEKNRKERTYFIPPSNESERIELNSWITWAQASHKIAFLESASGESHLVVIDLSEGVDAPELKRHRINRAQFVKDISAQADTGVAVSAKRLRFIQADEFVEITSFPVGPYAEKTIKVKVD